jgi:hypothetical protein
MVKITEKRTEKIPPSRIDNDLLFNLGQIMDEVRPTKNHVVSTIINTDTRDIESEDYKELKEGIKLTADTYRILMGLSTEELDVPWENAIYISIDTQSPKKRSRIRVRSNDSTWVQGVSDRLFEEFKKKRLNHRHIALYESLRLGISIGSSMLIMTVLGLALIEFPIIASFTTVVLLVLFYPMTLLLKRGFDWLFPYFEIDVADFKPSKYRKKILGLLWGSGFLGIIIELILNHFIG